MGHDSEQTTERHYGTMSDDRRFEVLENMGTNKTIHPRSMSEAEKAKVFDALFEVLGNRA
ncbi:MAG: hypothetical protein ACJAZ1_002538 [Yoonia sp.]|jgi:hypothetical protein